MEFAAVACRFTLGAVFLLAGVAKIPRRREFSAAVKAYQVLPQTLVAPVARYVPRLEIALGGLLLVGLTTKVAAAIAAVSVGLFTAAVAINLARGRDLDCGCFAVGAPRRIPWVVVARNGVLLTMAAAVLARVPRRLAADTLLFGGSGTITSGDAIAVLFTCTAGVMAITLGSEIWHLRALAARVTQSMGLVAT